MALNRIPTTVRLDKAYVSTQSNVPAFSQPSTIIDATIPRSRAFQIKPGVPVILFLYTRETGIVGSGAPAQSVVLTHNLVDSPSRTDAQKVIVYDTVGTVVITNYTINYVTNTLTTTGGGWAANAHTILYLATSATQKDYVEFRAADANRDKTVPILTGNLEDWHNVNQYSRNERQEFINALTLPEKQHLIIAIQSDVTYDFNEVATGVPNPAFLQFQAIDMPMSAADPSEFVKFP